MRNSKASVLAQGVVSAEEAQQLRRLRGLLSIRGHDLRAHPRKREMRVTLENRMLIRDCITRVRQARAGVTSPWMGLGQRESRKPQQGGPA
jgi:hypothetical protein